MTKYIEASCSAILLTSVQTLRDGIGEPNVHSTQPSAWLIFKLQNALLPGLYQLRTAAGVAWPKRLFHDMQSLRLRASDVVQQSCAKQARSVRTKAATTERTVPTVRQPRRENQPGGFYVDHTCIGAAFRVHIRTA